MENTESINIKPLTQPQIDFCNGILAGKTQADAYRAAYPKSASWKPDTVWQKASRLMSDGKVKARIEELRAELAAKSLWTREQSVQALVGVVQNPEKNADIVAAVKELNAMHGYNEPQKVNVTGETITRIELVPLRK